MEWYNLWSSLPISKKIHREGDVLMDRDQAEREALALFRELSDAQQLTYLSYLRSLLAGPEQAPADRE